MVGVITAMNLHNQVVHPRIQLMAEANKQVNNTLYYFSIQGVKISARTYWHTQRKAWLRREFDIPDILYLRSGVSKYDNKLIDMRAELQRNGPGSLDIIGIPVRLGAPGSPITTHADAYRFNDIGICQVPV
jgi:hypothetical protein